MPCERCGQLLLDYEGELMCPHCRRLTLVPGERCNYTNIIKLQNRELRSMGGFFK
jgi:uncharacterized Zn finger protein (UPF0148 family)